MAQNIMKNNALEAFQVPRDVYNAIQNAAAKTGVNFTYLMEKAAAESGFDPDAKARTSSATGLFQFIESTWLRMVKDHGDKYGLSNYADKISNDGRVSDSKARREILSLRKDPEIASLMAAEFAQGNHDYLARHVGGKIGKTELYMAHFLGAGGASGFLNAMKKSPNMAAADLFPKEARANRNVFYDSKTGAPKSLREIHATFERKFGTDPLTTDQPTVMTASNSPNDGNLLRNAGGASRRAMAPVANYQPDPFERLATLMNNNGNRNDSLLRMSGMDRETAAKDWQVFPSSLYGNLSLSSAQMMLLTDFSV